MSNTCVVNLAYFFGIQGRVISTCSACTSGSHAIGYGYEAIRAGQHDVMICGGAEEMHFTHAAVFDILYATSTPLQRSPRRRLAPVRRRRATAWSWRRARARSCSRSEQRARRRGAHIHGEVIGFGTSCDGQHVTQPSADGMAAAMSNALADARDRARRRRLRQRARAPRPTSATSPRARRRCRCSGDKVPISSTKGHTGHTLGACGALESAFCLAMMNEGFLAPTTQPRQASIPAARRCAIVRSEPSTHPT